MMLGDSVVFSLGVEYEDSIPYHLERLLNDTHTGSRRYRTLEHGGAVRLTQNKSSYSSRMERWNSSPISCC